jgi:tRNA(Ile)-lysidine synthase
MYSVYPELTPVPDNFYIDVSMVEGIGETGPNVLYLDRETLKEGLQLRKWKKGDYFYPLGMSGKQKIAKYFKDHKFSLFEKEDQWILCSGEAIVWLVGHRGDDRFKVRANTNQILRLEWRD